MRIRVEGASEHNLRDVSVELGDGLTVVTGVSGSGKSSLVFDTIYHESRRRLADVLSLGSSLRLAPAKVREISGLGPAIAVGQNLLNRNPASTLATASGLHPFLRLLYARFGVRHCAACGEPLLLLSDDAIVERLVTLARGRSSRSPRRSCAACLAATGRCFACSRRSAARTPCGSTVARGARGFAPRPTGATT